MSRFPYHVETFPLISCSFSFCTSSCIWICWLLFMMFCFSWQMLLFLHGQGFVFCYFLYVCRISQTEVKWNQSPGDTYISNSSSITGNALGRYCGNAIPDDIDTSGNVASVTFVTDGSLTASGFRLRFESSTGGELTDSFFKRYWLVTVDRRCARHWC